MNLTQFFDNRIQPFLKCTKNIFWIEHMLGHNANLNTALKIYVGLDYRVKVYEMRRW